MPIPGDNGNPQGEREAQERRIMKENMDGALVRKELKLGEPDKSERCIFGVPKR